MIEILRKCLNYAEFMLDGAIAQETLLDALNCRLALQLAADYKHAPTTFRSLTEYLSKPSSDITL